MVRLPGYHGACTLAKTTGEAEIGTNHCVVKSLVVVEGVNSKLIVDGTFFMPLNSGLVAGWKY